MSYITFFIFVLRNVMSQGYILNKPLLNSFCSSPWLLWLLPGKHCWQSPGPAVCRPPWPPWFPSLHCTPSPTPKSRFSPPAPPRGPQRGYARHSDAAVCAETQERNERNGQICTLRITNQWCSMQPSSYFVIVCCRIPFCCISFLVSLFFQLQISHIWVVLTQLLTLLADISL